MNKTDIFARLRAVLVEAEVARAQSMAGAAAHRLLLELGKELEEDLERERAVFAADGSLEPVGADALRELAERIVVGEFPPTLGFDVLLRRAAAAVDQEAARAAAAEAIARETQERPVHELEEARATITDLRAQLSEVKRERDTLVLNPIRQLRELYRGARVRVAVEFPGLTS